jgi:DNA-binding PadR family transcriptional regulator
MQAMESLNATASCVLGLLLLGPAPGMTPSAPDGAMTGWQIYETAVRSLARFWNVTRSQIYLELPRLATAGLVEDCGVQESRARRPYRITEAGRTAFLQWLAAFAQQEPRDDLLRSPLVLTVFFGDYLPPEVLVRVLEEYRPRWQRQLDQGRQMLSRVNQADLHRPPTAVLRRGVAYRELMVSWIDTLLTDLARLDLTAADSAET